MINMLVLLLQEKGISQLEIDISTKPWKFISRSVLPTGSLLLTIKPYFVTNFDVKGVYQINKNM